MIFLHQGYGNWVEKKEIAEDENLGNVHESRPQLVRRVSDSDKEGKNSVMSSRLLGELQRLNTSYNPDAKSQLGHLDGLTPRNSNSGGPTRLKLLT